MPLMFGTSRFRRAAAGRRATGGVAFDITGLGQQHILQRHRTAAQHPWIVGLTCGNMLRLQPPQAQKILHGSMTTGFGYGALVQRTGRRASTELLQQGRSGAELARPLAGERDVRSGKSGVPGLHSRFLALFPQAGGSARRVQSSRCARWISDSRAAPSARIPHPPSCAAGTARGCLPAPPRA